MADVADAYAQEVFESYRIDCGFGEFNYPI